MPKGDIAIHPALVYKFRGKTAPDILLTHVRQQCAKGGTQMASADSRTRWLLVTTDTSAVLARLAKEAASPRQDFIELSKALDARVLSYSDLPNEGGLTRLLRRTLGDAAALAWAGFRRGGSFYFTTAENTGMALAFLLRLRRRPTVHVMIGHRISAGKKRFFWKYLRLFDRISAMICYSRAQADFAHTALGVPMHKLHRIDFQVDSAFYTPGNARDRDRGLLSVGRELRDYPVLFDAVQGTDTQVTVVASSPWSRRGDQTRNRAIPDNVTLRKGLSSEELREAYRSAVLVVVPLQNVDSPAGVTSILEAQACGRPVIVSDSPGICDSIEPGQTALTVPCGDAPALRTAVAQLLADPERAASLGREGRAAVLRGKTIEHFIDRIERICRDAEARERP